MSVRFPVLVFIRLLFVAAVFCSGMAHAIGVDQTFGNHDIYCEFTDPYYADAGIYFSLTGRPIPMFDSITETAISLVQR